MHLLVEGLQSYHYRPDKVNKRFTQQTWLIYSLLHCDLCEILPQCKLSYQYRSYGQDYTAPSWHWAI